MGKCCPCSPSSVSLPPVWKLSYFFLCHVADVLVPASHVFGTSSCHALVEHTDMSRCPPVWHWDLSQTFCSAPIGSIPRRRKNVDEVEVEDETETKAKGTISIFGNLKCPRSQLGAFSHSHLGWESVWACVQSALVEAVDLMTRAESETSWKWAWVSGAAWCDDPTAGYGGKENLSWARL